MKELTFIAILILNISFGYTQIPDSSRNEKRTVPWFVERFKISAGYFYVVNFTNIQVGITSPSGTEINAEKDFGFNKELGTLLANFQWRISSRSRFTLSYYKIERSATRVLQRDIVFEGASYPINSKVNSYFNTTIYQISYGYAIFSKPSFELGLLIGGHILGSKAGISFEGDNTGSSLSENFGFTAPIPDLGIWGGYAFGRRFAINFDIDYLSLTINNKSGRVLAANFSLQYRLLKHLDLSLGYTGLNFRVDTFRKDIEGRFKWGYNGPALAACFSFGGKSWVH